MRIMTSIVFGCFFVFSVNSAVLAEEAARSVKDASELSEAVNKVLSRRSCIHISANSREDGGAGSVAMTLRYRCEGEMRVVSALLDELKGLERYALEKVVTSAVVNRQNGHPSVDVRLKVIALIGAEGQR